MYPSKFIDVSVGTNTKIFLFSNFINIVHLTFQMLFLSPFKIPVSIAFRIEKLQGDFLWSGCVEGKKDHLVSWDLVYRPKEVSGLGLGKISLKNQALLGKWLWR